jgi:TonB family protein
MSISQTAAQQRDRETRISNPVVMYGVVGSVLVHIGILPLLFWIAWKEPPAEPAQIEVVVTEPTDPVEAEPKTAALDEETFDSPETAAPQAVQSDPEPTASIVEPVTPNEPEESPNPDEPEPVPVDEVVEDEPESVDEQNTQQLDDLLNAIRQRRQQRSASRDGRPSRSTNSGTTNSEEPNSSGDRNGEDTDVAARSGPSGSDSPGNSRGSRTVACRSCPRPSYPRSALDAGAEGTVNIMVDISANGQVSSASLVGSSGNSALDQAALSAVRNRWRFQPITGGANGIVVSVVMTIEGSDLNRRARERGDRESIEVPTSDTASEEADESPSTAATSSDESPESEASDDTSSESSTNDASTTSSDPPASDETTDSSPDSPSEPLAEPSPDPSTQPSPPPAANPEPSNDESESPARSTPASTTPSNPSDSDPSE